MITFAAIDWSAVGAVVTGIAAGVAAWYTVITDKLRKASERQCEILDQQLRLAQSEVNRLRREALDVERMEELAAEPIFNWDAMNVFPHEEVRVVMQNDGAKVTNITFDPSGLHLMPPSLNVLDTGRSINLTFQGNNGPLPVRFGFVVKCHTRRGKEWKKRYTFDVQNRTLPYVADHQGF